MRPRGEGLRNLHSWRYSKLNCTCCRALSKLTLYWPCLEKKGCTRNVQMSFPILWFESSQDSFAEVGKKVCQRTELVDCQVHGRKKVLRRDSPKAGKEALRRRWPPIAMHKTIQPLKKVWEDCHRFHDGCDTACEVNDF